MSGGVNWRALLAGCLGVWLVLAGTLALAAPGGRVALVIGNGNYSALKPLPNPRNDAAAVARVLKELGYQLIGRDGKPQDGPEQDLDQVGLLTAVNAFAQAAQGQEIAFLYYAGHGFQDGVNSYLVPVDVPKPPAGVVGLDLLKARSVALNKVIYPVDGKARLMVAVFDACREIPELDTAVRASGLSGDNNSYQGLLPVYRGGIREPAGNATRTSRLIVYAGAAGQPVKDGTGEHSPYTQLLLDQLNAAVRERKHVELTDFFQQVAWDFRDPNGQRPLVEVAVQPRAFYLLPDGPKPDPDREPPPVTTGRLVIGSSQPPGVVIYVDGARLGTAPQELELPVGRVTVTARQEGYEPYQEVVWITAGRRQPLNVVLKPVAPPPAPPPMVAPVPTPVVTPPPPPVAELKPLQVFRDRLRDGSEGPAMVVIPAGEFLMGSPENEAERGSDERPHRVTVAAFVIGQYEVTFAEYDRFCAATRREKPSDEGWGRGRRPVINVSWTDAMAYTKWLSGQTGKDYRLPTEAEWEYAARARTTTPFWTGRCVTTRQANYRGNYGYGKPDCGAKTGNFRGKTEPVGSFPANPWGLYDTMGNVLEWTCSVYKENYDGAEALCSEKYTIDPLAMRGGCWNSRPGGVLSADRYGYDPADRYPTMGFRLARSL